MKKDRKKTLIVLMTALLMISTQAQAFSAATAADKTINCVAKGAYYTTKYTLKAGWFIVKNTAKGVVAVSKGIYNGGKDAFSSGQKPVKSITSSTSTCKPNSSYSLPPAPNY